MNCKQQQDILQSKIEQIKNISSQDKAYGEKAQNLDQKDMKQSLLEFFMTADVSLIVRHELDQYIQFQRNFYQNIIQKLQAQVKEVMVQQDLQKKKDKDYSNYVEEIIKTEQIQ